MTHLVGLPRPPGDTDPAQVGPPLWREALGRQLRGERRVRGERIGDVAARAGMSPQYLSELERGRKDPSSEMLSALAGALELSVLELTGRTTRQLVGTSRSGRTGASASGPVLLAA